MKLYVPGVRRLAEEISNEYRATPRAQPANDDFFAGL